MSGQEYMPIEELKRMQSGDNPGRTVGEVLPAKRLRRTHPQHVADVIAQGVTKPVEIVRGRVTDGHHRIAAAEEAGHTHVPVVRRSKPGHGPQPATGPLAPQ